MSTLHVHAPPPKQVTVWCLMIRARKWYQLEGRHRSIPAARRRAALVLAEDRDIRAVRVIANYEWYDPMIVFAVERSK